MPFVQTNPIQMRDNTANALVVREKVGGINYVEIDTIDGSEVIRLLPTGLGPVEFFGSSAEGVTQYIGISGYKTSGSLAEARLGVGVHTDQYLSIYNAQGYYFDNQILLIQSNTPGKPALGFGDGDSGFYEGVDDSLRVAIAGNLQSIFAAGGFYMSGATTEKAFISVADASATVAVFAFAGDTNTGVGRAAADQLSLIAGGVEIIRCVEGAADYAQFPAHLDYVYFFNDAVEGETKYVSISGHRTSGSLDEIRIAVGEHIDQTASFFGCARGYAFDTSVFLKEQAAALTDTADYGQTWVESTTPNRYMFRDDAGTDSVLNEVKGSFTMGTTGFGTPPSDTAYYTIRGNIVTLRIPAFSATSNSTDFTLTGLPAAIQPSIGGRLFIGVVDNGTPTYGKALFAASGTIQLAKESGNFGSGWTASGTKGTNGEFFVTYELAV